MKLAVRSFLIFNLFFIVSLSSLAHEESGDQDPYEMAVRLGTLFEKIGTLDFDHQLRPESPVTPFVRIKGRNYYLNDSFYTALEDVFRIYANEIEKICPECDIPNPESVTEQAKDLVARGWLQNLGEKSTRNILSRYGGEFVDLGARYGHMAGILKVMGELAEDALLVIFKMPGAHFLCDVITMVVSANAAKVSTLFNVWKNARGLNRGGIREISRLVATSYVAKRSLRRVRLEFGPVEVDPALFAEEQSDARQEWLAHEIDDEKRYRRFFERADQQITRYHGEIAELELQKEGKTERQIQRLERRISRLRAKLSKTFQVKRKVFEGRRLGYTFLIFKRKRRMTLYSNEPAMSSLVRGSNAWMVPLTATVTTPGFAFNRNSRQEVSEYLERVGARRSAATSSDINNILIQEASERGVHSDMLGALYSDIDGLFNTQTLRRERYIQTLGLHAFVGEFMSRLSKKYISIVRAEIIETGPAARYTYKLWGLQWRVGRLTYFSNRYVDYLRSVSLVRGNSSLSNESAFAKDYLLKILSAYEVLGRLKTIPTVAEVDVIKQELDEKINDLRAHQFWVEKRAMHSILPVRQTLASLLGLGRYNLFRGRPQCSALYY